MTDTNTNKVKEKQIGPWLVSIEGDSISIVGDSGSNFGRIYRHAQERFERHPQGAEHDWNRPQIIGMDWDLGMVPAVKAWIYSNL
jgi:hypothetical protein